MYECFPKHSRIETARIYEIRHKKTKKRDVRMKISTVGTNNKRSPNGLSLPNKNIIIINIIL